ncbi:MAG: DUF86 domain-containing protein [Deltaproteobacteria bacterium]|nr:DUF86 domain-containing protein [Deltaproteobacteria bacterium]MBW2200784.1 DUF86 domain-containing protein [Deltaproteobacteria bacterium]
MKPEFSGIERRLDKLNVCLKKLEPFKSKMKGELQSDPYLQDIIERNLQVAAQAVIDISNRIISIEGLEKPRDYYEAIIRLGEAGILPFDFAQRMAPIAGFRNILVHDYLEIDWDEVYNNLQKLRHISQFMEHVKDWKQKSILED